MSAGGEPSVERIGIILHSGAYDRASYALSIASVASALDMEVHLLLTYEGLRRFTRGHLADIGDETSPGVRTSIERGLKSGGIKTMEDQLADARVLGLKLYACPNAMATLSIEVSELIDEVDHVMGLGQFLLITRSASATWYI